MHVWFLYDFVIVLQTIQFSIITQFKRKYTV